MEDPSYIAVSPKRGRGRQDGPGGPLEEERYLASKSSGGNTTDVRKEKDIIDLGGVTKKIKTALLSKGGFLSRGGGAKLKYPLHNEANHPAKIKFTAYKADSYTIDPKAIAEIWDMPLLGWGTSDTRQSYLDAKKKRKRSETLESKSRYTDGDGDGGFEGDDDGRDRRTVTVGGPPNRNFTRDAAGDRARQQIEKDAEASSDAKKGANRPDQTNIVARPADGVPVIELYFPQSLTFNDDVTYNPVDLGPSGLASAAAMNNGRGILSAINRGITEGVESIFNLARGQITREAAQVAGARATQFIPREGIRAAITTATQVGINPGTRVLFEKPNIRQFSFTFKLIATSAQEANQIESIIKTFRTEMYPETINIANGTIPAGYKFPNLFKIEFSMSGADMKVPALQYCYLRSAQSSYNATSMTFHPDGHPTEVDLTLVFQEYRILSKQDIEKGF